MKTFEWKPEYGKREDHDSLSDTIMEFEGFHVGDEVVAIADGDESNGEFFFEGEDGTVIGVLDLKWDNPAFPDRKELLVYFDGMDPISVMHPSDKLENLSR